MLVLVAVVSIGLGIGRKYVFFVTRTYAIDDILADGRLPDELALSLLIMLTISSDSWAAVGGPADIGYRNVARPEVGASCCGIAHRFKTKWQV